MRGLELFDPWPRVAATKWRQHVAVDVSPQNRFALRIKPRSGDRKDRCRHYRGWYAEHKARSQQSEAYRNSAMSPKREGDEIFTERSWG